MTTTIELLIAFYILSIALVMAAIKWCLYIMLFRNFYFQLCVILEPMQELMSRHKAYALNPRDCLKSTLFQKWQRMVAPPGKRGTTRNQLF